MKRFAATLLSFVLMLSVCAFPASASGESLTMTPNVTTLKSGDVITIAISTSAVTQARGVEFHIVLPTDVFENVAVSGTKTSTLAAAILADDNQQDKSFSSTVTSSTGKVNYVAYWDNAYDISAQTLLTITASVKTGATLGSAAISWTGSCVYSDTNNHSVSYSASNNSVSIYSLTTSPIPVSITEPVKYTAPQATIASGTGYTGTISWNGSPTTFAAGTQYSANVTLTAAANYKFNASQTVTVSGASDISYTTQNDSTVSFTATFPKTETQSFSDIKVEGSPSTPTSLTVPVVGVNSVTQQFKAYGIDGSQNVDITGNVTWSIATPVTHTGISISSSGLLTIDNTAASNSFTSNNLTLTVQASTGSLLKTLTVTLLRSDSVPSTVSVGGGASTIIVPEDSATVASTTTFAATVYDQYGSAMAGQTVSWSYVNGTSTVDGITISGGILSVSNSAKSTVTETTGIPLTVTASVGSVSGTGSITVKRASPVVTSITVGSGDSSILVPGDSASAESSEAFTAVVYDQYGTAMTGQTVSWTVKNGSSTVNGVTISDGIVSVANSAKSTVTDTTGISFTVAASIGSVSGTGSITVKRDASAYTGINITRGTSSALTSDLLVIPQSGSTDYTYTATVYDQYGAAMTDTNGTWSGTIGTVTGVTRTDNKVTVSSSATAASSAGTIIYTEKVSGHDNSATLTISLSTMAVDWSGVSVSSTSKVYGSGTTYASFATLPSSGTANDGVTSVSGTFSVVNGTSFANVSDTTITVRFTVTTAGNYSGLTFDKTYPISVSKCTLTVTPASNQSKVYGTNDPVFIYTYSGNVASQTPDFDGVLSRGTGEDVGTNYSITAGTLALKDSGSFKKDNYQLSFTSGIKFAITPATIAITDSALSYTLLASDTVNTSTGALKAIANNGSALPNTVGISYSGKTGTIEITWADATQTFNAKGGTYTFIGTAAANSNYANRPTFTATVKVDPVTVTDLKKDSATALTSTITIAKADVLNAASLAAIGVPSTAYITFDNSVTALSGQTVAWDKTLADVKTLANTVSDSSGDKTIVLTVKPETYPAWATAPSSAKTLTITVTNKYPVSVTFITPIDDVIYGTALATPVAEQAAINNGTDTSGNATFTYTYVGTGSTVYGPSTTAPSNAGTYKVVATLKSDTHAGTGDDAFTIAKKALANTMITGITPASNTYTGGAVKPTPTVTDAAGPIAATDYTVSWENNVSAGTTAKAVITATATGNYTGSAEYTFTVDQASLSGKPTIAGTASVGNVLTANHSYSESEVTYQWTRGGTDITGQTSKTYTLTSADSNQSIGVKVSGKGINYLKSSTITSDAVTVAKQAISGIVVITGGSSTVTNTDTLTANISGIVPSEAQTSAIYKWTATSGDKTTDLGTSSTQALTGLSTDTVVTLTVTPNSNYSGTLSASVTIGKKPLVSSLEISGADLTAGSTVTPTGKLNGADISASSSDYSLQWMRNGNDISGATGVTYTVTKDDLGAVITLKAMGKGDYTGTVTATGSAAVVSLKPDAPVISSSAGDSQITISWTAPAANGSPITGYTLYMKESTGSYGSGTAIGNYTTSYTVSGLTNGTSYVFKLTATNAVGVSESSSEITAIPNVSYVSGGSSATASTGSQIQIGNVSATVTKSGDKAVIGIDNSNVDKVIKALGSSDSLKLDVSNQSGVTAVSVPQNVLTALDNSNKSNGNSSSVKVELPGASISIDSTALSTIVSKANGSDITISAKAVDTTAQLTQEQKSAVGSDPVYDLSLSAGNTKISQFGGGTITVTLPYTLTGNESASGVTVYYLDGNGNLQMLNNCKYDATTGKVTFTVLHFSLYVISYKDFPFSDVSSSDWFFGAVKFVNANGIFNGVDNTKFAPSVTMNRAMFVSVLGRLAKASVDQSAASTFSDVVNDGWSTGYITWANKAGIISGYSSGEFGQYKPITREQMAVMMYNYAKFAGYDVSNISNTKLDSFKDASAVDGWAADAMAWAVNNGILSGVGTNTLAPTANATRAQVAQVLLNLTNTLGSK